MDNQLVTEILAAIFWVALFIIFYTYLGYGILLVLIVNIKRRFYSKQTINSFPLPKVSLIVAAYNEQDCINVKIENTFNLNYPSDLLEIIVVTDGSSDNTPDIVSSYQEIIHLHEFERRGKLSAINRAAKQANNEILVFTDANSVLTPESILKMVRHFSNPSVGGVTGEKKIAYPILNNGTEGEGFYWKYESFLKRMDSELHTIVGAAGELFAIRKPLWEELPENTLIEDFVQSLRVCVKGYVVRYEPTAIALESPSESIEEELIRKVRISAGAFQAIGMLPELLNIFRYPITSFQYLSHRILRWTITPVALLTALPVNILLVIFSKVLLYQILLGLQIIFYFLAFMGWSKARKNESNPVVTIPFYFFVYESCSFYRFPRLYFKEAKRSLEESRSIKSACIIDL